MDYTIEVALPTSSLRVAAAPLGLVCCDGDVIKHRNV